jgi:galactokinase
MDQGCAYGLRPILMTFDGDCFEVSELEVPKDMYFVIVDLQSEKDTKEILTQLNRCYPFARSKQAEGVQELLGRINKRLVHQAVVALQGGMQMRLGELMVEAQTLFDRYAIPVCPGQLTAPVLHKVLSYEPLKPHIFGGKGVGSQGDGAAQLLARSESDQRRIIDLLKSDLYLSSFPLTLRAGQTAVE